MTNAPASGAQIPKGPNAVGRIALAVSVIGLICMWAAMPLGAAVGLRLVGVVACVAGWILMPIGFAIGCAGLLLSRKGKAASTTAIVLATIGGIGSFIFLLLTTMPADAIHTLPN